MIDFKNIKCKKTTDAFVGIKKGNKQNNKNNSKEECRENEYCFFLPKGMDVNKLEEDENKEKILKELFFNLYKLQKKFGINNSKKRDGTQNESNGAEVSFNKDKPLFYFDIVDFLRVYNKTEVVGLNSRIVKNEDIDYSRIDQYLEDALYTKEGIPVILESFSSKNVISISSNEIIKMYCFIYENIKNELGEEVDSIIKKLSNEFRNKYLNSNKSIFESKSIAEQCKILLEKFRKNTLLLKDTKKYYDAIYKFLYFEINDNDGLVMGINNFYSIWEELCFDYFFNYFKNNIYCADYDKKCNLKNESKEIKRRIFLSDKKIENYSFKLIVNTIKENEKTCSTTYIFPDLVFKENVYLYEIFFENKHLRSVFSNENFNISENEFLTAWEEEDFYIIGCEKNIYEKLLKSLIEEKKITNLNKNPFVENKRGKESSQNNKIKLTTLKSNKGEYYINYWIKDKDPNRNKIQGEKDYKYLKDNLKIIKVKMIDFKYKNESEISDEDIIKQKIYELCLGKEKISVFILPKWDNDVEKLYVSEDETKNRDIPIIYFNLKFLLKKYLKND